MRWPWLAAAAVLIVIVGVVAIRPARETVARWFGVTIEQDDGTGAAARGAFADGVAPLDVDDAIAMSGLDPQAIEATTLGRPDAAGTPPEGGVLLAWREGATTLWVRPGDDDVLLVKRLGAASRSRPVTGFADYAVLIDGPHVLETPARRVAAGRVLWWLGDNTQNRLESDLDEATLLDIGRALALS